MALWYRMNAFVSSRFPNVREMRTFTLLYSGSNVMSVSLSARKRRAAERKGEEISSIPYLAILVQLLTLFVLRSLYHKSARGWRFFCAAGENTVQFVRFCALLFWAGYAMIKNKEKRLRAV